MYRKYFKLDEYFCGKDIKDIVEFVNKIENSFLYIDDKPCFYVEKINIKESKIFLKDLDVHSTERIEKIYGKQPHTILSYKLNEKEYFSFESNDDQTNNTVAIIATTTSYCINNKKAKSRILRMNDKTLYFNGYIFNIKDIKKQLLPTTSYQMDQRFNGE